MKKISFALTLVLIQFSFQACTSMNIKQQEMKAVKLPFLDKNREVSSNPRMVNENPGVDIVDTPVQISSYNKPMNICIKSYASETGKDHGKKEANFLIKMIDFEKSCGKNEVQLKKSYLDNYIAEIDSQCSLHATMMGAYAQNLNMRGYYASRHSSCLEKRDMAKQTASTM